MRLIEVLPDYEAKRFSRPPVLSSDERKIVFKLDPLSSQLSQKTKQAANQIGLLVQYGYFKVSGKFFTTKTFRASDIKAAAKEIGTDVPEDFLNQYHDRTRQKHRIRILEHCGYIDINHALPIFDEMIGDMVDKQMHPRKLFYILVEQLRQKKIEVPSYDRIARTITDKFHDFEKNVTKKMAEMITPEQQEALNQLIMNDGEYYERVLLTRLKTINQSMRPAKIKQGIRNFLIIKKLHQELRLLIMKQELSSEATKYYAGWVNKAKATQIAEMTDLHKRNLHLVAFIDHWYKLWQDTFIDILLKAVQQQVNKAAREVDLLVKSRLPEKNKLTESVLSGFNEASDTLHEVRTVVHDNKLNNDEKIQKLHKILPSHKENNTFSQAEDAAKKLYDQIEDEKKRTDEFDALGNLSRKLQNRVAEIVKYLEFEAGSSAQDLYLAIVHYQNNKNISSTAPDGFLNDHEYKAIYSDGKFNISLYKAILFCKIANAIKCGQISLIHSYRYLSIDAYLLNEQYWQDNKIHLIEKLGLTDFSDVDKVLSLLKVFLDKQFFEVNRRITQGKNKYVTIHKDGHFSLHTPAVAKPDTVNWYFSLDNLYAANQTLVDLMGKLWLLEKFKRERNLLHTSSDGKKQSVSAESLNTNHSYKYFGNGKGASVYRFIDERGILFYSTVFSSAERDAIYVIDGLLHNDAITSNFHSTDTHGYTEMVFAVSHLINVTFAPRIKDIASTNLVSFGRIKAELESKSYVIKPTYYVNESKIKRNWDTILRLIATIKLREHRASTILKRLGEYSNQHPLEEALKEFGRIIKSIFVLKYIDDVEWRKAIE